jgi:hypothetical protein
MGWHIGILFILYKNDNAEKVNKEKTGLMVQHSQHTLKLLLKKDGISVDLSNGVKFFANSILAYYEAENKNKFNGILLGMAGYMSFFYFETKKTTGDEKAMLEYLNKLIEPIPLDIIGKNDKFLAMLEKNHPYNSVHKYFNLLIKYFKEN